MADYRQDSAYATTELYGNYLDVMSHRNIPVHDDDTLFTITSTYQHRPDLLANDLYNNANLWWVFQIRNPNSIKDPVWDFVNGLKIYLPKQDTLEQALGL